MENEISVEDLVILKDKNAVTTSLKIAEVFGKNHRDVMKKIRELTASDIAVKSMFTESTYLNGRNQSQPMYYMNRDGFTLLAMGFSGSKALKFKLKYIEAFNEMEEELKPQYKVPQTMSEALYSAYKSQKELEELQPKVEVYDNLIDTSNCLTVTQIADNYADMSAIKLNKLLVDQKIQYKKGNSYHLYKNYKNKGLAVNRSYAKDNTHVNLVWTYKGQYDIYFILKEQYHILPVNEEFKKEMESISHLFLENK